MIHIEAGMAVNMDLDIHYMVEMALKAIQVADQRYIPIGLIDIKLIFWTIA